MIFLSKTDLNDWKWDYKKHFLGVPKKISPTKEFERWESGGQKLEKP